VSTAGEPSDKPIFLQATAISVEGAGVLLRGAPGSGKSDLALRLIDGGAELIADDGVELMRAGKQLMLRLPAAAPPATQGRLEVRGLGILPVPTIETAALGLVIELLRLGAPPPERLPESATISLLGLAFPVIRLAGLEASAPAKVRLAVRAASVFIIAPP
jgi:serine kinase of HPr protein (carbohydrate metabolism regulator)